MKRRTLLRRLCEVIASTCLLIVAIPAIQFVIAPLMKKKENKSALQRVAQLKRLTSGVPQEFPVIGNRRDAWTLYSNIAIGRVWVVLRSDKNDAPEKAKVEAYSSICPHLRCTVQMASSKKELFCPCHNAVFGFDGAANRNKKNPSPRDMDSLTCNVVQDAETEEWWVEVEYQKFKTGLAKKELET